MNQLLDDLFPSEKADREQLLKLTLRHVRQRRRTKVCLRVGTATLAMMVVALTAFWSLQPVKKVPPLAQEPSTTLPPHAPEALAIVATVPLLPEQIVETPKDNSLMIVGTDSFPDSYQVIDDEELFALVGKPAVIVRQGQDALLVIADETELETGGRL